MVRSVFVVNHSEQIACNTLTSGSTPPRSPNPGTILTTWTFLLIPFVSLFFDLQPVKFGFQFALAAALYLVRWTGDI